MKDQRETDYLSLFFSLPPPSLCVCVRMRMCSETDPDIEVNQTVFWFSNEICQESPIRKFPVKITENMFCAGSSLESSHSCKVTLFPLRHCFGIYISPVTQPNVLSLHSKRDRAKWGPGRNECPPSNQE